MAMCPKLVVHCFCTPFGELGINSSGFRKVCSWIFQGVVWRTSVFHTWGLRSILHHPVEGRCGSLNQIIYHFSRLCVILVWHNICPEPESQGSPKILRTRTVSRTFYPNSFGATGSIRQDASRLGPGIENRIGACQPLRIRVEKFHVPSHMMPPPPSPSLPIISGWSYALGVPLFFGPTAETCGFPVGFPGEEPEKKKVASNKRRPFGVFWLGGFLYENGLQKKGPPYSKLSTGGPSFQHCKQGAQGAGRRLQQSLSLRPA